MSAPSDRLDEIDGIRGILSIIVVAGHLSVALGISVFSVMQRWYWMPMDVFFVISGFLLGRIAIPNSGRPGFLKAYFIRRVLRIWPAYFATVLIVSGASLCLTIAGKATGPDAWTTTGFLKQVTFTPFLEYVALLERGEYLYSLLHTWSVAIEEHFYALLPLFALLLRGRMARTIILALAIAALVSVCLRLFLGMHAWVFLTRMHSFALGLFLAYISMWPSTNFATRLLRSQAIIHCVLAASLIWLFVACWLPYEWISQGAAQRLSWISQSLAAALFAFCLLAAILQSNDGGPGIPLLRHRYLTHLGEISYSTYLWHWPILVALRNAGLTDLDPFASSIIAVALVLLAANASYYWIELPFLRMKHLWKYRNQPGDAATAR